MESWSLIGSQVFPPRGWGIGIVSCIGKERTFQCSDPVRPGLKKVRLSVWLLNRRLNFPFPVQKSEIPAQLFCSDVSENFLLLLERCMFNFTRFLPTIAKMYKNCNFDQFILIADCGCTAKKTSRCSEYFFSVYFSLSKQHVMRVLVKYTIAWKI